MKKQNAFTLIELLVVVAIIALLISILLPSIESARAQAQAAVCATHLHDVYAANNNYANQFSDWIPGAPGTSAGELAYDLDDFEPYGIDTPGIPVQNWDWQTPLAHYGLGYDDFPRERNRRWAHLRTLAVFTCPSNNFVVPPYPIGTLNSSETGFPVMLMNSYSTVREFMYFGLLPNGVPPDPDFDPTIPDSWDVDTPEGHVPRFTSIQRPSQKGLVVEGSRYMRVDLLAPDYDVNYSASVGGSFATAGPSSSYSRAFINPVELDTAEHDPKWDRYSFRHPVGTDPGMNVLFFDGHVERMNKTTAIEGVDFWLPSGTKVGLGEYDGTGSTTGIVRKPRAMRVIESRIPDDEGLYPIR